MKKTIITITALTFAMFANAEEVHQKAQGEAAYVDGKSAVEKGKMEVREVKEAEDGKVARVKGEMSQWGFVSYWLGIPTPDGKSKIRIRIYHDGQPTATYAIYINVDGQKMIQKIEIPADAKKNSFVNIDIPVDVDAEWSGIFLKKFEKSDKPSPWIDSISVLVPEE